MRVTAVQASRGFKKLIFFSLLALPVVFAASARAGSAVDCAKNFAEPVDTVANLLRRVEESDDLMPKDGAYRGEAAENIKSRTLKYLTVAEKLALGIAPTDLAFANYRDHGRFYVATVSGLQVDENNNPTGSNSTLSEVRLLQEHWDALTDPDLAPVKSHTYLKFVFSGGQGVRLVYDQAAMTAVDPATPRISSVVLSIEAIRPQSDPDASFIPHSLVFDFAIGNLVYSAYDRAQSELADTGKVLDDQALNLATAKSRFSAIQRPHEALLFRAIQSSVQYGRSRKYNVVIDNCTNETFDVLDTSLLYPSGFNEVVFKAGIQSSMSQNLPKALDALAALAQKQGVVVPPSELTKLSQLTPRQISAAVMSGTAKANLPTYFSWLPLFVEPHLSARGLQ